jgi:hypothetical protein
MRMTIKITVTTLLATLLFAAPGRAADEPAKPDATQSKPDAAQPSKEAKEGEAATQEQVQTLAEEIRRLKLELGLKDVEYQSYGGLGPAASKVYYSEKGLSIGGYGEINYQNAVSGVEGDETDLLRAVVYLGYRFNRRIVFNSEIEFEHAGHEVSVEFAYLDFLFTEGLQLRIGNMLMPVGITNELHEPPFFNGVFRPAVETLIIPSTWSENGVALHGRLGGLRYHAALVAGLDVLKPGLEEPVTTGEWLRRARTGSAEARAATAAGVLALEYDAGPVTVGGSFYGGRADQRRVPNVKATVTLTELHARAAWRGVSARALAVVGTLGDAAAVSGIVSQDGYTDAPVQLGSRVQGGYAELAYDLLSAISPGGESSLSPFVRLERYDLNADVPSGQTRDPSVDVDLVTAGLTFKPIATVVLKTDWQRASPREGDASSRVSVGAGFVF